MIYNELKQHGTDVFPVEYYHITEPHPKYQMAYHWHGEVELIRIIEGKLDVTLDNSEKSVSAGDYIFVNSETVHGATPIDCIYDCIVFNLQYLSSTEETVKSFIESMLDHSVYVNEIFHPDDKGFCTIAKGIFDAISQAGTGYTFAVTGGLYSLLGYIYSKGLYSKTLSISSVHNEKNVITLKKALAFMRKSYDTQIALSEIADAAEISPKYLCTFFKEMTGQTPFEYLNTYRIERAARKLISSDTPVTQVAFSCGFNDLSYFIKMFKKNKGVTPKNFRKSRV